MIATATAAAVVVPHSSGSRDGLSSRGRLASKCKFALEKRIRTRPVARGVQRYGVATCAASTSGSGGGKGDWNDIGVPDPDVVNDAIAEPSPAMFEGRALDPSQRRARSRSMRFWRLPFWPFNAHVQDPETAVPEVIKVDRSVNASLVSRGTTISQFFDQDKWERHRRVGRYFRSITPISILTSTVFRRILPPCGAITFVAFMTCAYNLLLAPYMGWRTAEMNSAPVMLIAPLMGLLLVFRTNGSYARFTEGRLLWGGAVRYARDIARLTCTYLPPEDPHRHLIMGYIQAWGWILKAHLRSGRTRPDPNDPTAYRDDPGPEVRLVLPPEHADRVLNAKQNRPYVAVVALTVLVAQIRSKIPALIADRYEEIIIDMGATTGGCERLLSTPMPVSYTRFTGRSLMLWLMSMPLALWPQLGWTVVPAMFIISYVVIGIDEIGVEIEEPFCILPLLDLCNALKRDCKIAMDNADLFKSQFAEAAAAGAAGAAGAGAAAGAAPGGGVEAKLA